MPIITLLASVAVMVAAIFIPKDEDGKLVISASGDWYNYMANVQLVAGNYEEAENYLTLLYQACGDTSEGLVTAFRMSVLQEDDSKMKVNAKALDLFMKEHEVALSADENKLIKGIVEGTYKTVLDLKADKAMYESLEANDTEPEQYGYEKITDKDIKAAGKAKEELLKGIAEQVEEMVDSYESDNMSEDLIDAYTDVLEACDAYAIASPETEEAEKALKQVKNAADDLYDMYTDNPEIFEINEFSDAYLNAVTMANETDKLIEYATESCDADALALVANLYISGVIDEKDFSDDFIDDNDYDEVIEHCEEIFEDIDTDDMTNAEVSQLEDEINSVNKRVEEPVLSKIEEELKPEEAIAGERAAAYVQDSVINAELEDKQTAFESLDKAIENVYSSDSEELQSALNNINSIIEDDGSSEQIKDINEYFDQAYQSSLPTNNGVVSTPENFINTGNSYANEKKAMINIGMIKTEDFETVRAYISTSGLDLMASEDLIITDCGLIIEDYTIEKVKYNESRIYLVCDNSGSMDGSIEALQEAVRGFVDSMNKSERVGIVRFDSYVLSQTPLTGDISELNKEIDSFGAYGGTYIKGGVDAALAELKGGSNAFKSIIVMTDGMDSSYYDSSFNELRQACIDNGIILYTIGLGDVSADYLETLADYGMGSFVYCSDSVQLAELYSFIHNQMDNIYCITYKAKDVVTQNDRILTVSDNEAGYSGKRVYSLSYEIEDGTEIEDTNDNPDGIKVSQLGVTTVVKAQGQTADFTILGEGFNNAESTSVKISDTYTNLPCKIDSDSRIIVTIPAGVPYGTYDVTIYINGSQYTLKGLNVIPQGMQTSITFGDYVFSAYNITQDGEKTVLSGNVIMNDYLHFRGDVTLSGNLEGSAITLTEANGSYIQYDDKLPGLLGLFFDNAITFTSFGSYTIYDDGETFDDVAGWGALNFGPIEADGFSVNVKPEGISFKLSSFEFEFPGLEDMFKYLDKDNPFDVDTPAVKEFFAGKDKVGIDIEVEMDDAFGELKLGKANLEMDAFTLKYNTFEHSGGLEIEVGLSGVPIFKDPETAFGFDVSFLQGQLNNLKLGADVDIPVVILPNPPLTLVSLSDFAVGVNGLVPNDDNGEPILDAKIGTKLLNATWFGGCDVDFFSLGQVLPPLQEWFDGAFDITILKLDDTTLSLRLSNFNLSLDTTAMLCEAIDLGSVAVDIGNFDFKSKLLGINNQNVQGVSMMYDRGFEWSIGDNFVIDFGGSTQVTINNKFAGFIANGDIYYDIQLFKIIKDSKDLEGNCIVGLTDDYSKFTILIKGDDYKKNNEVGFRLSVGEGGWIFPDVDVKWY